MFFERYVTLCNSVNKAPTKVAVELGITSGSVNGWKNGAAPRYPTLKKIAQYFDVPIDYLKGEIELEEFGSKKENPSTVSGTEVSDAMKMYSMLTPENQKAAKLMLADLLKGQIENQ